MTRQDLTSRADEYSQIHKDVEFILTYMDKRCNEPVSIHCFNIEELETELKDSIDGNESWVKFTIIDLKEKTRIAIYQEYLKEYFQNKEREI